MTALGSAKASTPHRSKAVAERASDALYRELGLAGQLDTAAFNAGYSRIEQQGVHTGVIAIADLTQPSTAKRLYVIDLDARKLLLRTFVAHGSKTGDLNANPVCGGGP